MALIQEIKRCGLGMEVIIGKQAYFVDLASVKDETELKAELTNQIGSADLFDKVKFDKLKPLEGTDTGTISGK